MSESPSPSPDARPALVRWTIMVAAGLMLFGSDFAYDSICAVS